MTHATVGRSEGPDGQIPVETYFAALAEWWHDATDSMSSPSQKAAHPAYERIVALGPLALPFIFRDLLERGGGDWYIALRRIVGFSPVPPSLASDSSAVVREWLAWARANGYA